MKKGFVLSDVLFAITALILCMYLSLLVSHYLKSLVLVKNNIYMFDEIKNKMVYEGYTSEKFDMSFDVDDVIFVGGTKIYIKTLTVKEDGNVKREYTILQK